MPTERYGYISAQFLYHMSTPNCRSVYPLNDMGTHQYRLCAQIMIETALLTADHILMFFIDPGIFWVHTKIDIYP